jgi:cytochrome c oxidase subunit 2
VLTQVVLVYAMYKFTYDPNRRSEYTHGNNTLEIVWTAIPAAILLFIGFAQIYAWQNIKYQASMPAPDITVSVMARQWEWRMRYPVDSSRFKFDEADAKDKAAKSREARKWAENQEFDDVHITNEIHCWKDANVKVYLQTQDVLHSFTLPNLRVKQDTLPGKTIPMWFKAIRANTVFDEKTKKLRPPADRADTWEIACQELCGGRHYAMRGRLWVHETKESYENWLKYASEQQNATKPATGVAMGN